VQVVSQEINDKRLSNSIGRTTSASNGQEDNEFSSRPEKKRSHSGSPKKASEERIGEWTAEEGNAKKKPKAAKATEKSAAGILMALGVAEKS